MFFNVLSTLLIDFSLAFFSFRIFFSESVRLSFLLFRLSISLLMLCKELDNSSLTFLALLNEPYLLTISLSSGDMLLTGLELSVIRDAILPSSDSIFLPLLSQSCKDIWPNIRACFVSSSILPNVLSILSDSCCMVLIVLSSLLALLFNWLSTSVSLTLLSWVLILSLIDLI